MDTSPHDWPFRDPDLIRSPAAAPVLAAMRRGIGVGWFSRQLRRWEGGPGRTATLRHFLHRRYGTRVGAFSYGAFMVPGEFIGVEVGRFVSMARHVAWGLNHPWREPLMNPVFYGKQFGVWPDPAEMGGRLEICADAWIGDHVVITQGCVRIGLGAVVGAGAVVTRDVPDYAMVVGNPARVVRMRFPDAVCQALLDSRWWERPLAGLREFAQLTRMDATNEAAAAHIRAATVRSLGADGATAPRGTP